MLHGFLPLLLAGTWVTIKLAVAALILGLLLGITGASMKLSNSRIARSIARVLTSVVRGVPELLVLFLVYFGGTIVLSKLFGKYIAVSSFIAGVSALALIFGAYATETFRGAYLAIPTGQFQAAAAYGFYGLKRLRRIILPQVWRHALPGLGNLWFVLLKDTALVSLIGLTDLMRATQNATAFTKQPFTFFGACALIYLLLTSLSMIGQKYISKRVSRHIRVEG